MMTNPFVQFLLFAVFGCGGLWLLGQFPADSSLVKFIKIGIIVVLAILLANLILILLFGHPLTFYTRGA